MSILKIVTEKSKVLTQNERKVCDIGARERGYIRYIALLPIESGLSPKNAFSHATGIDHNRPYLLQKEFFALKDDSQEKKAIIEECDDVKFQFQALKWLKAVIQREDARRAEKSTNSNIPLTDAEFKSLSQIERKRSLYKAHLGRAVKTLLKSAEWQAVPEALKEQLKAGQYLLPTFEECKANTQGRPATQADSFISPEQKAKEEAERKAQAENLKAFKDF